MTQKIQFGIGLVILIGLASKGRTQGTDANPGDIVIVEVMVNPSKVTDANGEWFEVYNTTGSNIDLHNWKISSTGDATHTIGQSVVVPAGGVAVLGRNSNPSQNGGYTANYQYTSIQLNNTSNDSLVLRDVNNQQIDRIDYTTSWPFQDGKSMTLKVADVSGLSTKNDDPANWATESTSTYGLGDFGTPGSIGGDQSLPITLTSFTATAGDGQVTLRWTTESEIDNSGFEIWRSMTRDDGYVKLPVFIPGAGNAASRHDYEYTDRGLANGTTYYYKLIDVDFGGHRTEHGPVFATPHTERVKGAETRAVPKSYRLAQNYPNPFNPATRIRFDIPLSEKNPGSAVTTKVKIFDLAGREVATLVEEPLGPGSYEVTWDGVSRRGEDVSSGVYLCLFETTEFSQVRKMTLLR